MCGVPLLMAHGARYVVSTSAINKGWPAVFLLVAIRSRKKTVLTVAMTRATIEAHNFFSEVSSNLGA